MTDEQIRELLKKLDELGKSEIDDLPKIDRRWLAREAAVAIRELQDEIRDMWADIKREYF